MSRLPALAAVKENYQVSVDLSAVGVATRRNSLKHWSSGKIAESRLDSFMGSYEDYLCPSRRGARDYSMLDKIENPQLYSGFGRFSTPLREKVAVWQKKLLKLHVLERQTFHQVCDEALGNSTLYSSWNRIGFCLWSRFFLHEWRPDLDGTNSDLI